jgi:hypothetical protein
MRQQVHTETDHYYATTISPAPREDGHMEREQRWLLVCDQLREPRRSWLSRTARIHGYVAPALPEQRRDQDQRPFRTFAEAEEACDEVIEHLATLDDLRWSKQ